MNTDALVRALRTAAQGFISTVVTLWGAAGVFSVDGVVDTSGAKRFGLAVVSAAIASVLSLLMTLAFGGTPPANKPASDG